MNHFEEFNIPVQFFPDLNLIRNRYYELSRLYHPDLKDTTHGLAESELEQKSSDLNSAYRILMAFDLRVAYVLTLYGLMGDTDKASVSSSFLMEMMDVNESVMEAKLEADTERLRSIAKEVEQLQDERMKEWEAHCRQFDKTQDQGLLSQIKDDYLRNKYLLRLKEQLEQEV
ncbi:MAG TPA: Fe-S protein assembly co-chaperone HscB [Bacteroidetes bacterium]|nr:Fe-S protein assembly co-chaperone HscB [Bacteroidota bacterium]